METALAARYCLGKSLGSGSHGCAVLATRIADGQAVVIKQVKCSLASDTDTCSRTLITLYVGGHRVYD
jgi:hypothetical protein